MRSLPTLILTATLVLAAGCVHPKGERLLAASPEAAGRYLVLVVACNDCHTPGWMERGPEVPESEWLTGLPIGWRGPWGTTYGSNLRRYVQGMDEASWVAVVRARNDRPPMIWPSLHALSEADLRALFRYIESLPVKGETMPAWVPPGEEPTTPYFVMDPQAPRPAR